MHITRQHNESEPAGTKLLGISLILPRVMTQVVVSSSIGKIHTPNLFTESASMILDVKFKVGKISSQFVDELPGKRFTIASGK